MDALLMSLGMYAVNCAGRLAVKNGIAYTAQYTTKQCARLLKTVDDKGDCADLKRLQKLLNSKIKILTPAIDLIEFKAGRGNPFLENAVPLAKSLQRDIAALGRRLEAAAATEEVLSGQPGSRSIHTIEQQHAEMKGIIDDIKSLLARVDMEIQFIQLAISGSGETLSSSMPPGISPSRFAQASSYLNLSDCQFACDPTRPVQTGPSFTLSLYMLFLGHSSMSPTANGHTSSSEHPATPKTPQSGGKKREKPAPYGLGEGERKPIWQEVMHKARFRICRTPVGWVFDREKGYCSGVTEDTSTGDSQREATGPYGYSYHLEIVEDLDDGRLHDEDGPDHQPFDTIPMAGIRESLSVSEISKIFYTNTGKLLNIGSSTENNPVLLLKRDVMAAAANRPRRDTEDRPSQVSVDGDADSEADSAGDEEQSDIDRQLSEESEIIYPPPQEDDTRDTAHWEFPQHLDQEWLALEVFVEDDEDESDDDDDLDEDQRSATPDNDSRPEPKGNGTRVNHGHGRSSSIDDNLLQQIRNLGIQSPTPSSPHLAQRQSDVVDARDDNPQSFVARSPFGSITSSLSLLEMLIRLTSLQQFQQTTHLAIPDYILTFFLEETSTTGLNREQQWKVRGETKRRVGFDPYTDSPARDTPAKDTGA